MPYASSRGVRIYYQTVGDGPPLVLQHGFSSSGQTLRQLGYPAALPGRRLILVDARGHGLSDKPHEPEAYALPLRVADIVAVLDELAVERADYLGYSMGGWIGFGLLIGAPQRIRRALLGGAHPFADDAWASFDSIDPADDEAFLSAFEAAIAEPLPEEATPGVLTNDRAALKASAGRRESLLARLLDQSVPTLLYTGSQDARAPDIARAAELMGSAELRRLDGLTHAEAYMRPDLVAPSVVPFLDSALPAKSSSAPSHFR
ncbi:MAG: alpha/beta fold hydrolase [Phycisphaerales bacterium JB039]